MSSITREKRAEARVIREIFRGQDMEDMLPRITSPLVDYYMLVETDHDERLASSRRALAEFIAFLQGLDTRLAKLQEK